MRRNVMKKLLCLILMVTLTVGFTPTIAFAGWDDGTECEYCGGYRFDDWLCDCGPHCSEFSDEVDCYLAHHCANCLQSCDEDEKCDECDLCPDCQEDSEEHCEMCKQHADDICDGCHTCGDCQQEKGFHCDDCGQCMLDVDECEVHPMDSEGQNHCNDCAWKCNDCGDCFRGEYEEIWCEDCNQCFGCAVLNGYHCNECYACVHGERCEECELCVECGIAENLHCSVCENHVEEWCDRGGEGSHCAECAEEFTCEQCQLCTECAGVAFCEECGVCEDCCYENAAAEGCTCGDYCVADGGWLEHFCPECDTCFDEVEKCETCEFCVECCSAQSDCSEGLCIEDPEYDEHFCQQCNQCFHDTESCESCTDAGIPTCAACCQTEAEELGCTHEYCPNSWQWEEHYCLVCKKCFEDCDHEGEAHSHVYDANGNCKVCGLNKDGSPVISRQPKSVVATYDDIYAVYTVEALGSDLKYQWYYVDVSTGKTVYVKDGLAFKGANKKTLNVYVNTALKMCKASPMESLFCDVSNSNGHVVTESVKLSVSHKLSNTYETDTSKHWLVCEVCGEKCHEEDHDWSGWIVVTESTLEKEGEKYKVCRICKAEHRENTPKLTEGHAHDFTSSYVQGGEYHWGLCACGKENKGEAEKHIFGDWTTTIEPSAVAAGEHTRSCTVCGYTETETMSPQGHTHEFYNEEYKENHKDNGHYGQLIYNDHYVNLYSEPYGKTDKNYHYAKCVVDGCEAYEKYSHKWETWWIEAPTESYDGSYDKICTECFYKVSGTYSAGKYRIMTKDCKANVQDAKPGAKVKLMPYSDYPAGYYFNEGFRAEYTYGNGASGTWEWIDVEHHKPDADDSKEYWYFIMPSLPSGCTWETFWVEVEADMIDCCLAGHGDDSFEWVNMKEATCGEPGYTGDYMCTWCNYIEERGEVIPILEEHGPLVKEEDYAGTCTKSGYIGGLRCSVCNELVVERQYTGKAHNPYESVSAVKATCTQKGSTAELRCADCGIVLEKIKPVAKTSHRWKRFKGTATCTSGGIRDYAVCRSCEQISIDGGKTILRNKGKLKVDALGHDFSTWKYVNGTTHQRVCSRDGSHIETANHTFAGDICIGCGYNNHVCSPTVVAGKAATCLETGKAAYYKCSCGKYYEDAAATKAIEDIDSWGNISAKGHTEISVAGKAATCKETGLTAGKKCTTCGTVTVAQTVVPKLTTHSWNSGNVTQSATCTATGVKTYTCTVCSTIKTETIAKKAHSYNAATCTKAKTCKVCGTTSGSELGHSYSSSYRIDNKATTSADGSKSKHCTRSGCTAKSSVTAIPKIASVKLSTGNYTYNGSAKKPSVTVKNSKGTTLKNGTDYTVSYASGRTKIGKYKVTVTFKGNYSGSKALYFEIGPKNPSSVKTTLYGYDDVKVSWSKVSGASGYKVYYKKSSASSWTLLKTTTATSYKKANLSDGVKYDFKVVTYKTVSGNACENAGKTSSIYTLKKVSGVKAAKSSSKVKVSWTNISGETGYQISQSTSKTGTKVVATYKTTSGKYKTVSATKGKTYYYKVRAYKVVGSTKIYGPWSSVVKYKR